jgi:hypothetical protein
MEIQISHQAKKCKLPKKSSKRNQNTKLPSFHNSSTISSFNASRNIIFQESSYKRSWVHTRVRGQGLNRAFLRDPVSTNPAQVPALPPPHRSFPSHCRPARCLCVCGSLALSLSASFSDLQQMSYHLHCTCLCSTTFSRTLHANGRSGFRVLGFKD